MDKMENQAVDPLRQGNIPSDTVIASAESSASVAAHNEALQLDSKKKRRRTTSYEKNYLEDMYNKEPRPGNHLRKQIAQEINWSEKSVQVWFQNRRQKGKARPRRSKSTPFQPSLQPIAPLQSSLDAYGKFKIRPSNIAPTTDYRLMPAVKSATESNAGTSFCGAGPSQYAPSNDPSFRSEFSIETSSNRSSLSPSPSHSPHSSPPSMITPPDSRCSSPDDPSEMTKVYPQLMKRKPISRVLENQEKTVLLDTPAAEETVDLENDFANAVLNGKQVDDERTKGEVENGGYDVDSDIIQYSCPALEALLFVCDQEMQKLKNTMSIHPAALPTYPTSYPHSSYYRYPPPSSMHSFQTAYPGYNSPPHPSYSVHQHSHSYSHVSPYHPMHPDHSFHSFPPYHHLQPLYPTS
ncbi:hypothetical protein BKA69DRAFT_212374 [Paraphysoderma sedebokerense]|nr:hypothetical protein BKA69DRAFT_212374 [Paraphysoderma sedebokerense]